MGRTRPSSPGFHGGRQRRRPQVRAPSISAVIDKSKASTPRSPSWPAWGGGGEEIGLAFAGFGRCWGFSAAVVSLPTVALWRPLIRAGRRQLTAPMWRPFNLQVRLFVDGSTTVWFVAPLPSGMFPGKGGDGRRASSSRKLGGEVQGPDCVLIFSSKVLCAKFRGQNVIFLFVKGLYVICTSTAWY